MRRILGIDPGTVRLGYGLLEGGTARPVFVASGLCSATQSWAVARRLAAIQKELIAVLETHRPSAIALETSFHGKNAQAMLRLGEARGMVIGLAGQHEIEVFDYSPAVIKKAVTGRGNADKLAVARMVRAMLTTVPETANTDATDALAAALCHFHRQRAMHLTDRVRKPTRIRSLPNSP